MLVLTRRPVFRDSATLHPDDLAAALAVPGHGVLIGPNVLVRVLSISAGQVRLGIEAPLHVKVRRDELGPA